MSQDRLTEVLNAVLARLIRNWQTTYILILASAISLATVIGVASWYLLPGWAATLLGIFCLGSLGYFVIPRLMSARPTLMDAASVIDSNTTSKDRALSVVTILQDPATRSLLVGPAAITLMSGQIESALTNFNSHLTTPLRLSRALRRVVFVTPILLLLAVALWSYHPSNNQLPAISAEAKIIESLIASNPALPTPVTEKLRELQTELDSAQISDKQIAQALDRAQAAVLESEIAIQNSEDSLSGDAPSNDDTRGEATTTQSNSTGQSANQQGVKVSSKDSSADPKSAPPPTATPTPTATPANPQQNPEVRDQKPGEKSQPMPKDVDVQNTESAKDQSQDGKESQSSQSQDSGKSQQQQSQEGKQGDSSQAQEKQEQGKQGNGKQEEGKDGKEGQGKEGQGKEGAGKEGQGKEGAGKDGDGKDQQGQSGAGQGSESKQGAEKDSGAKDGADQHDQKGSAASSASGASEKSGEQSGEQSGDQPQENGAEGSDSDQQGQQPKAGGQEGKPGDTGQANSSQGSKGASGSQEGRSPSAEQQALKAAQEAIDKVRDQVEKKSGDSGQPKDQKGGGQSSSAGDKKPNDPSAGQKDNKSSESDSSPGAKPGDKKSSPKSDQTSSAQEQQKGSADAQDARTSSLPQPGERTEQKLGDDGPEGPGLGDRKGFKEAAIPNTEENVDPLQTGNDAKLGLNRSPVKSKTTLEDAKMARPEPLKNNADQPIPLEYRGIIR